MYTATIKKLATGEERDFVCKSEWNDSEEFDWSENNRACDCSRAELFAMARGEEDPNIPCSDSLYIIPRIVLPDGRIVYSEALTAESE